MVTDSAHKAAGNTKETASTLMGPPTYHPIHNSGTYGTCTRIHCMYSTKAEHSNKLAVG